MQELDVDNDTLDFAIEENLLLTVSRTGKFKFHRFDLPCNQYSYLCNPSAQRMSNSIEAKAEGLKDAEIWGGIALVAVIGVVAAYITIRIKWKKAD